MKEVLECDWVIMQQVHWISGDKTHSEQTSVIMRVLLLDHLRTCFIYEFLPLVTLSVCELTGKPELSIYEKGSYIKAAFLVRRYYEKGILRVTFCMSSSSWSKSSLVILYCCSSTREKYSIDRIDSLSFKVSTMSYIHTHIISICPSI